MSLDPPAPSAGPSPSDPWRLAFVGRVPVGAWWIDRVSLGPEGAWRQLTATWEPDARLHDAGTGWVVILPQRRWVRPPFPAGPLVAGAGGWLAAPPSPPPPPGEGLARVVGGRWERLGLGPEVDWTQLLALPDAVELLQPLEPARLPETAALPAPVDRAALGVAGPDPQLDPQVRAVLAALKTPPEPAGWAALLGPRLAALAQWLRPRSPTPAEGPSTLPAPPAPLPAWRERLGTALATWADRLGWGMVLGPAASRWIDETLSLFDRGDLEEALKRSIALDGEGPPQSEIPALQLPAPRQALRPALARASGPARRVPVAEEAVARLRAAYRRALERLLAEERWEQAAFVMADLLGDLKGAIALLEQRRAYRLAAGLALHRLKDPALAARLLVLEGELAEAAALARQNQVFGVVIQALEASGHREEARFVRLVAALHLAAAGRFLEALRQAPSSPSAPTWRAQALEQGGPDAAWLLVQLLVEEDRAEWLQRARVLLADDAPASAPTRAALAEALTQTKAHPPRVRRLAVEATRALVRDGRWLGTASRDLVQRLQPIADDAALAADLPRLPNGSPGFGDLSWPAEARGLLPVTDLLPLPDGGVLLAHGEAGLTEWDPRGVVRRRWSIAADQLIGDGLGRQVVAVRPRGERVALTRLDRTTGEVEPWALPELVAWEPDHDGETWHVATSSAVLALDLAARGWRALWQQDRVAPARGLRRLAGHLWAVLDGDPPELWRWELPRHTLRWRTALVGLTGFAGLTPVQVLGRAEDGDLLAVTPEGSSLQPLPGWRALLASDSERAVLAEARPEGTRVFLRRPNLRTGLEGSLLLSGASRVAARFLHDRLWVGDELGRVLAVDPQAGLVLDART